MTIVTNGAISDISQAFANNGGLREIYARNGQSGEWVLVWPTSTIKWYKSVTPAVEFIGGYKTPTSSDPGTISGVLGNVVIYVGYDTAEKWTDNVGNTGDHVGRLVYGSDFDGSLPVLSFDIAYDVGPKYSYKSYKISAQLNPFYACDGSGKILVPRTDYDTKSKGGSNILYMTSSTITIDADGKPTILFEGQPYYGWDKYQNTSFPGNSASYARTVANNLNASTGLRYGQDYWPVKP